MGLVDRDFFAMLDQLLLMGRSQGQSAELEALVRLREKLLNITPAGQVVKQQQEKARALVAQITPATSREELVDLVVQTWLGEDGQQLVGTLAVVASQLIDYQFLMLLSERIGGADQATRPKLDELRQFLLQMQEQLAARRQQSQEAMVQQAQALLVEPQP